jgi:hypothetical protein
MDMQQTFPLQTLRKIREVRHATIEYDTLAPTVLKVFHGLILQHLRNVLLDQEFLHLIVSHIVEVLVLVQFLHDATHLPEQDGDGYRSHDTQEDQVETLCDAGWN